jgi:membrane protein involved in D-alanine export
MGPGLENLSLLAVYALFIALGGVAFRVLPGRARSIVLAGLSIASIWYLFFFERMDPVWVFPVYAAAIFVFVALIGKLAARTSYAYWVAFLPPVLCLVFYKGTTWHDPEFPAFVGISYMSFRVSYLAYEINSDPDLKANYWDYISHMFFLPTFLVGPISPFDRYREALIKPLPLNVIPVALLRIFMGLLKFMVFAPLIQQFSFMGWIENSYSYDVPKLALAAFANFFYLYMNFSGLADIAIGCSGIIGIRIMENFDKPLLQTNVRTFWDHWHISLSRYVRDIVYTPLMLVLLRNVRFLNGQSANAIAAFTAFFLIGIWHGNGINFVLLGFFYAIGVVFVTSGPDILSRVGLTYENRKTRVLRTNLARFLTISYMAFCVSLMFIPSETLDKINAVLSRNL